MTRKRIVACAAAFALTLVWAGAARAQAFDGVWNIAVYTTNGHCGVTSWQVAISGGQVYAPSGAVLGGYAAGLAGGRNDLACAIC